MPEYGRHIHQMIDELPSIPNRQMRTAAAYKVVNAMEQLVPSNQPQQEYKRILWDHLHIMGNYSLDIDSPYPMPERESAIQRPEKVPYTQANIREKHYGRILVRMIKAAGKMPKSPERDQYVKLLAVQMRKLYQAWNRADIQNAQIAQDFFDISDGNLTPDDVRELLQEMAIQAQQNYYRKPKPFTRR